MGYDFKEVDSAAKHNWESVYRQLAPELAKAIAISASPSAHTACPIHGGTDGFRMFEDWRETGGGICNTCENSRGDHGFKTGWDLLPWLTGWTFERTVDEVGKVLGCNPRKRGRPAKARTDRHDAAPRTKDASNRAGNRPGHDAQAGQDGSGGMPGPVGPAPEDETARLIEAQNRAAILARWRSATVGSPRVAGYLAARGLTVEPPETLRFTPDATYKIDDARSFQLPAMLAQLIHPTAGVVAIHRTYLSSNPSVHRKADESDGIPAGQSAKKLSVAIRPGATVGAAIRLFPHVDNQTLAIAEGIETALAVNQATCLPTWAAGNAGAIATIELPEAVKSVEIWADSGSVGQTAAKRAAERFLFEGRTVRILTPPDQFSDWLDFLIATDEGCGADGMRAAQQAAEPYVQDLSTPPTVILSTKEFSVVNAIMPALCNHPSIYRRLGSLVHVVRDAKTTKDKINRPAGTPRIIALPRPRIRELITETVNLCRRSANGDESPAAPPDWLAKAIESRGEWPFARPLEGIVETPVFLRDGSILTKPGYDPSSGLIFEPNADFPEIPSRPTKDDAYAAANQLLELVVDFPFENPDVHRAAVLAAILTPFARNAFDGCAPLFLIDANVRGAGKSLLANLISILAVGRVTANFTNTSADEEMRKRITAIAIAGDPIVMIDNIDGSLGTQSLDAVITSGSWKDRILGTSSTTQELPLRTTWYASGNNVNLRGDMSRRVLRIRLESPDENPEERAQFTHPDIAAWTQTNRPRLVVAALTILRAYQAAGRPAQTIPRWGSFEAWSDLIRGAIVWMGFSDPCAERKKEAQEGDTTNHLIGRILDNWPEIDGSKSHTAAEIARALNAPIPQFEADKFTEFRDAISELLNFRFSDKIDARKIGNSFRKIKGRVVGKKRLKSTINSDSKVMFWHTENITTTPFTGSTGSYGVSYGGSSYAHEINNLTDVNGITHMGSENLETRPRLTPGDPVTPFPPLKPGEIEVQF